MKDLERIYKALGNRRRLEIIKRLKEKKELSVSEIARHLRLSIRSTSRHLTILRAADVVDKDQRGLLAVYSLNINQSVLRHCLSLV